MGMGRVASVELDLLVGSFNLIQAFDSRWCLWQPRANRTLPGLLVGVLADDPLR